MIWESFGKVLFSNTLIIDTTNRKSKNEKDSNFGINKPLRSNMTVINTERKSVASGTFFI